MGRVFVALSEAVEYSDLNGKKFADALAAAKQHVPDLTWQELALYNWGTKEPREVNRALIELFGCGKVDPADPTASEFLLAAGPGGQPKILCPKLWRADNLAVEKTHTVKLRTRDAAPAVSITALTSWFTPEKATCRLEYALEGVTARARKVDFEVRPSRYFDLVEKDGEEVEEDYPPDGETARAPIFQRRKLLEVTTPRAPADPQTYSGWSGQSEASKGVLKQQGSQPTYITYGCAPYAALIRYYQADADQNATVRLAPFRPKWTAPTEPVADSLVVAWEIDGDNDKLVAGQLLVIDKNDRCVFRSALSKQRLRSQRRYDLLGDSRHQWNKSEIKADGMPYRVQLQAHSSSAEAAGLAVAVMHTEVQWPAALRIVLLDPDDKGIPDREWELVSPVAKTGKTLADGLIEVGDLDFETTSVTLQVKPAVAQQPAAQPAPAQPAAAGDPPTYPPVIKPEDYRDKDPPTPPDQDGFVEWTLALAPPGSYTDGRSIRSRLRNLGFDCDAESDEPTTERAVKAYQAHYMKQDSPSGKLLDIKSDLTTRHDTPDAEP